MVKTNKNCNSAISREARPQVQREVNATQGDADVETEASDEQQQEAVRAYREKIDEYEALSESVLESESIPLGHRQTIRNCFEMLRPYAGETDAVNQKTDSESTLRFHPPPLPH